jgi:hypothetical protein
METKNLLFLAAGLIVGILGTLIYCEYSRNEEGYGFDGETNIISIVERDAASLRQNYKETFRNDPIEGYNISFQQLIAIDSTLKKMDPEEIRTISGFRLYKGLTLNGDPQSEVSFIVYPIGNDLRMRLPKEVYRVTGFDDKYILPCPAFCD